MSGGKISSSPWLQQHHHHHPHHPHASSHHHQQQQQQQIHHQNHYETVSEPYEEPRNQQQQHQPIVPATPAVRVVRVVKRRNTANKKERRRTMSINNAFSELRDCIPNVPADTKLSKIKTLRLATSYISYLMTVLDAGPESAPDIPFRAELGRQSKSDKMAAAAAAATAAQQQQQQQQQLYNPNCILQKEQVIIKFKFTFLKESIYKFACVFVVVMVGMRKGWVLPLDPSPTLSSPLLDLSILTFNSTPQEYPIAVHDIFPFMIIGFVERQVPFFFQVA